MVNMKILLLYHSSKFTFLKVVGGYFTWMTIYAVNQTMIQRYLTVKTLRTAKVIYGKNLSYYIKQCFVCRQSWNFQISFNHFLEFRHQFG